MYEAIIQSKNEIEAVLKKDLEHQNKKLNYILINPQTNEMYAIATSDDEVILFTSDMIKDEGYERGYKKVASWDYNFDTYFFEMLEQGYEIGYISNDCHAGLNYFIDELYPNDVINKNGVKKYLKYCEDNGITKEFIEEKINVDDISEVYMPLSMGDIVKYCGYVIEIDDINPSNKKENLIQIYYNDEDFNNHEEIETVSLKTDDLKQNIIDYIEENYDLEEKDMNDELSYFSFALGYDILKDFFENLSVKECNQIYMFCNYEASQFLESREYKNPKYSGYDNLTEWVDKNKQQIFSDYQKITRGDIEKVNNMKIVDRGFRNQDPIALIEKTIGNEKEYIIAFFYQAEIDKLDWAYGYYYDDNKTKAMNDFNRVICGGNLADTFVKKERGR